MNSLILKTATDHMLPLLLLFSMFLLVQGHNEPGGGFVGGLMAGAAVGLYAITHNALAARTVLRVEPQTLIGSGLLLALGSGIVGLFAGRPLLSGLWTTVEYAQVETLHLGTPQLFDVGVYLVVFGVSTLTLFSLLEE